VKASLRAILPDRRLAFLLASMPAGQPALRTAGQLAFLMASLKDFVQARRLVIQQARQHDGLLSWQTDGTKAGPQTCM